MEFLSGLLQNVVSGIVVGVGASIWGLFQVRLKEQLQGMKPEEVRRLLESLGATSPDRIRMLVYGQLGKNKNISGEQREELVAVLINLVRGASLFNSQGNPRSAFVRIEELIERLLAGLQPKRKAGEKVCSNHDWTLERFLGMGAFGEVWAARNSRAPSLPARAYKFFTHDGATHWLRREQENLTQITQKLKGEPQIVELLDVTVPDRGYPFLALEYVGGGSLEDWIMDANRDKKPLRKAQVMRGIVRAMAAAHLQKIYHCDLKPANILLTLPPDIQPKITDFGLSSIEVPPEGEVSGTGMQDPLQVGTPMYWPPEAQRPFAERQPALFDVFAVGVIWYQLLVERIERPPYDFAEELRKLGEDSHTIQLISRCLAHPDRRFHDAAELGEHMDQADLPVWNPVPTDLFDVGPLVREFVGLSAK